MLRGDVQARTGNGNQKEPSYPCCAMRVGLDVPELEGPSGSISTRFRQRKMESSQAR